MEMMGRVLLVNYKPADVAGEIPYLCKRAGLEVSVFCDDNSWLLKNSFWEKHIRVSSEDAKQFVLELEKHLEENVYDWVCLVDEKSLWVCAELVASEKNKRILFPVLDGQFYKILGSKCGLAESTEETGLVQPDFEITNLDYSKIIQSKVSFPFLIKFDKGGGGDFVFICRSNNDVLDVCKKFPKYNERILVQTYIEGETISVEMVGHSGDVLAYAPSIITKNVSNEFSVALYRDYFFDKKFETILYEVSKKLTINGLGSLTFIRKDGEYYLIEVDLRSNVWFRYADYVGVNFSDAIRDKIRNVVNKKRPVITEEKTISIAHFGRNLLFILKNKDTELLLKWMKKEGFRKFIPVYDRRFLYASIIDAVRAYLYFTGSLMYIQKCKRLFKHR